MKRSHLLEQATTPDGSTLSLHMHDDHYMIRVNGRELMSTRHSFSEEKLAELACKPFKEKKYPKVLIGGLGLGFTLRSALAVLPAHAQVVVAELMPQVVAWNKNPDYKLAYRELEDRRTQIILGDVFHIISQNSGTFDAIMLDADNGTTAMHNDGNRKLYQDVGLAQVHAALKGNGIAAYWSAQDEPVFEKRMGKAGFKVEHHKIRSHETSGSIHTILVGCKTSKKF